MKDLKKGARELENTARETGRKLDGDESVSDQLGNAGDEVRDALKKQKELDQRRVYQEHAPR